MEEWAKSSDKASSWPSDEEGDNELLIEQIREENADQSIDTDVALSETNLFEQNDVNFMVGTTRREDIEHISPLQGVKDLIRLISRDQS